ncbi:hypothetical protein ACMV5L_10385 [Serratia plymuthica]|uniref:hypothetical protein n=1 Tax=Serratia plymuthica TaxID=82996 RepID=UPI003DA6B897
MNQGYFTYYEGYDVAGRVVTNGNSSFDVEAVNAATKNVLEHTEWLLGDVKQKYPSVARVVIKQLVKL